jgi:hypothetical protein
VRGPVAALLPSHPLILTFSHKGEKGPAGPVPEEKPVIALKLTPPEKHPSWAPSQDAHKRNSLRELRSQAEPGNEGVIFGA